MVRGYVSPASPHLFRRESGTLSPMITSPSPAEVCHSRSIDTAGRLKQVGPRPCQLSGLYCGGGTLLSPAWTAAPARGHSLPSSEGLTESPVHSPLGASVEHRLPRA